MTLVLVSDYDDEVVVSTFRIVQDESHGRALDADPAVIERWQRIEREWGEYQDELARAARHCRERCQDRTERGARIIPTWPP